MLENRIFTDWKFYADKTRRSGSTSSSRIINFPLFVSFTDITIELRAMGVPWTLHCWMNALAAAHELRLDTVIDQLLQDFLQVCPDDYSQQFVMECLPLLFSIFRYSKVCVSNNFTALLCSALSASAFRLLFTAPSGFSFLLFVLYNFYERTHKSDTWLWILFPFFFLFFCVLLGEEQEQAF